jgi:hypothetical protein
MGELGRNESAQEAANISNETAASTSRKCEDGLVAPLGIAVERGLSVGGQLWKDAM